MLNDATMKSFDSSNVPDARWDFAITFTWESPDRSRKWCRVTFILPKPKSEQLFTAAKMALSRMCDLCKEAADNNCKQSDEPRAWGERLPYVPTKISEHLHGCEELCKKISPGERLCDLYATCSISGDDTLYTIFKCLGCLVVDRLPDELQVIAESGPSEADRETCSKVFSKLNYANRDSADMSKLPKILATAMSNPPEEDHNRVLPLMFEFESCHALEHFRGNANSQDVFGYIFKLPTPGFSHVHVKLKMKAGPEPAGPSGSQCRLSKCKSCGAVRLKGEPPFKLCANCKEACYCSKECQKRHWPDHKTICKKKGRE